MRKFLVILDDSRECLNAMRFAAMLWPNKDARPGELRWFPKKKRLELLLTPEAAPLYGEVAQARFQSLADTLNAEVLVKGWDVTN